MTCVRPGYAGYSHFIFPPTLLDSAIHSRQLTTPKPFSPLWLVSSENINWAGGMRNPQSIVGMWSEGGHWEEKTFSRG